MVETDGLSPDLPPPPPPKYEFRPAAGRAQWFIRFAWLALVSEIIGTALIGMEISLLNRIESGNYTDSEVELNDTLVLVHSVAASAVFLIALVVSYLWLYRVNKNSWVLRGAKMKFRPGWSVGWWFIPFANLVQPYRIMCELWRANIPGDEAEDWSPTTIPSTILFWWLLTLGTNITGYLSGRLTLQAEALSEHLLADGFYVASSLIGIAAWYMSIRLVRRIQAGQERLAMTSAF